MLKRSPEEHRRRVSPTHSRTTATLLAAGHQNTQRERVGRGWGAHRGCQCYTIKHRGEGEEEKLRSFTFHQPRGKGKGFSSLCLFFFFFSPFAPLLSFSFHPHVSAEDGSVCVCAWFVSERANAVCANEIHIRREGLKILCSGEANSFGEKPCCCSSEHFFCCLVHKLAKGRLHRPCKIFTSIKLRLAG